MAVVCHIGFLTMTLEEFETGPAKSGVLTDDEITSISKNFISPTDEYPMPKNLSNSRAQRGGGINISSECASPQSVRYTIPLPSVFI